MDCYFKISDDKDLLLLMEKDLLSSLNEFCISTLDNDGIWIDSFTKKKKRIIDSWDDAYRHRIDGYLVSFIVQIIESGVYTKDEIYSNFKMQVHSCLKKYGCSDKGLYDIFQHAWTCRYTKQKGNRKSFKLLREIALEKQPLWLRIINSNRFVIFGAIMIFVGAIFVGNHFIIETKGGNSPFLISLLMTFFVIVSIASSAKLYSSLVPIGIALLACGYNILFEEHGYIVVSTCKTWLWMAMFYLLWYPVLCINYTRMKDAKLI